MDEDLDTGGSPEGSSTNDGPSLIDTLSTELGLDDNGDTSGSAGADGAAEAGGAGGAADTGAAPAGAAPGAPGADGAPPVDPAAAAKPDPNAELYAPLPEHNPRRTHERFQRLVDGHKEVSTKLEAAETERETLRGQVQQYEGGLQQLRDMGFTDHAGAQDLHQFAQFRHALAKGDHASALRIMQPIIQQLQLASGGALDINPLAPFPDLAQRVQVGELDQATAIELARGRHGQQVQQQHAQSRQQAEQQHHQQMEAIHAGQAAVVAVDKKLQMDPDYATVLPAVMKELPYIKERLRPEQWASEVERTYGLAKRALIAETRNAAPARVSQQPLRASGHGGGAPEPKSALDAAMQALGIDS